MSEQPPVSLPRVQADQRPRLDSPGNAVGERRRDDEADHDVRRRALARSRAHILRDRVRYAHVDDGVAAAAAVQYQEAAARQQSALAAAPREEASRAATRALRARAALSDGPTMTTLASPESEAATPAMPADGDAGGGAAGANSDSAAGADGDVRTARRAHATATVRGYRAYVL